MTTPAVSALVPQLGILAANLPQATPRVSQAASLVAYGPAQTQEGRVSSDILMAARAAGASNVVTRTTQMAMMVAYGTGVPGSSRSDSWTFVMDGHRFYVLPLGPEGDWAYDTTTQEWSQLQSQGFPGMNFKHGVMWGLRVMGSDVLYTYLYELDPNQANDEAWRAIVRMVTGGVATRSRASIGVANFLLTASVGDDSDPNETISLAFSDDNGFSWSEELSLPLTDVSTQTLLWSALGSFSAPGRVFRITDTAGPIRLDGADAVLTVGNGVDAGQDQDKSGQ